MTEVLKKSDFYYQAELYASGKCYKKKDIKMSSVVNRNILHKYLPGTNNSSYTCIYAHINMYTCIHNTCHEQREDKLNWMLKGKIRKHGNHNPGKRKIRQHLKIPECLPVMGHQGTDPESWKTSETQQQNVRSKNSLRILFIASSLEPRTLKAEF